MDETTATILRGCTLARELEENLERYVNEPEALTRYCEDIIRVFGYVRNQQKIKSRQDRQLTQTITGLSSPQLPLDSTLRKRLRIRNGSVTSILRAPATVMGDIHIPPEDGYSWKKVCDTDIFGCKYPRLYYRCAFPNCPAKKQAQRLDEDPQMFEIVHKCLHTCPHSSTAPTILPPSNPSAQIPPLELPNFNQLNSMGMVRPQEQQGGGGCEPMPGFPSDIND